MTAKQIAITLPADVRAHYASIATAEGIPLGSVLRRALVQAAGSVPSAPTTRVENQSTPDRSPQERTTPILDRHATVLPERLGPPPPLVDVAGRPRAPDPFDTDYEPPGAPVAARRRPDPEAPRRWRYQPPG